MNAESVAAGWQLIGRVQYGLEGVALAKIREESIVIVAPVSVQQACSMREALTDAGIPGDRRKIMRGCGDGHFFGLCTCGRSRARQRWRRAFMGEELCGPVIQVGIGWGFEEFPLDARRMFAEMMEVWGRLGSRPWSDEAKVVREKIEAKGQADTLLLWGRVAEIAGQLAGVLVHREVTAQDVWDACELEAGVLWRAEKAGWLPEVG